MPEQAMLFCIYLELQCQWLNATAMWFRRSSIVFFYTSAGQLGFVVVYLHTNSMYSSVFTLLLSLYFGVALRHFHSLFSCW